MFSLATLECGLPCDIVDHGPSCYNLDHCVFGNKCCAVVSCIYCDIL